MSERKKRKPEPIATVVAGWLGSKGLAGRVEQAGVIPDWASLVGPQIAAVTEPLSVTAQGTLFVSITTNGWMTELSLIEPELLRALNAKVARTPIKRIRWTLRR